MKGSLTELVFILDCSGSMHGLEADTIGGFNSMLDQQRGKPGEAFITTFLFSSSWRLVHDRVSLEKVQPMTRKDYITGGCTALFDTVGHAIAHIESIHRYARPEDVPAQTMFIIITDGMENASREYTRRNVKEMIEGKKRDGWEFLFLGANIDAAETADTLGIAADRAVDYHADSEGTRQNFRSISDAIDAVRSAAPLTASWKKDIERDFRSRKK